MTKQVKAVVNEETKLIENIIVVNGTFDPGPGKILMDVGDAEIGGTWDGMKFQPPPVVVIEPDPNIKLREDITAANTLEELKTALLDSELVVGKVE